MISPSIILSQNPRLVSKLIFAIKCKIRPFRITRVHWKYPWDNIVKQFSQLAIYNSIGGGKLDKVQIDHML